MKMIESVTSFYTENVQKYSIDLLNLNKRIHRVGTIRLILLVIALFVIWHFRSLDNLWLLCLGLGFAIPFLLLVIRHNKLFEKRRYVKQMIFLNEQEIKAMNYDFSSFDGAPEKISSQHDFGFDLDLLGEQSVFQSLNRTVTGCGRDYLISTLEKPFTDKESIQNRQTTIRELQEDIQGVQHFLVTAKADLQEEDHKKDLAFLSRPLPVSLGSRGLWNVCQYLIPALWTLLIAGYAFNYIPGFLVGFYFIFCLVFANWPAKKINKLYQQMDKTGKLLGTYARLFQLIEERDFTTKELQEIKAKLLESSEAASDEIKRLSRIIGALDQRFSLAGILANLFYLRDIRQAIALEDWYAVNSTKAVSWIEELGHYDALLSMSVFSFNHPDYNFPKINDTYFIMDGKQLGHPLLPREECVKNDVSITKAPGFLIITGANMAGKSTYLRTVGVNFVLACTGMPVCADSLTVYPASLVTSLRTADSLTSGESYFFAELKRLKMIIDRLDQGERLFIILDEILKGTNSLDKQKGSLSLMRQLVNYGSCGIIATHDLVLGTLIDDYPNEIANYRFEAEIKDEELTFSYQLQEGVAQNMNASFLMRKMGITLD